MGAAKAQMMRHNDLVHEAGGVLVRAGAAERCEFHDEVLIGQCDSDAERKAYAIGTNMVKAGEVDAAREEFMDAIKSAIVELSDECYMCAHALSKDD